MADCMYGFQRTHTHTHSRTHVNEQSLQERGNAKQHNTTRPKQSFFKEKLATSGGHDHQLSRQCSYQLSYRGSSAGWAKSCIQIRKHHNLKQHLNLCVLYVYSTHRHLHKARYSHSCFMRNYHKYTCTCIWIHGSCSQGSGTSL